MGSLMSGWDSHILDSKSAKYKRNHSLTKEGIESYWKSKKKIEEENLRSISFPSHTNQEMKDVEEFGLERSSSLPEIKTEDIKTEKSLEDFIKKNGWWKGSNWAFLNEPPVLEQTSNTYAAQFHIANSKPNNNTGISA
ncbi:uncharacterized protein [Euphorbia lathyris]|uniref:uncharacterized protein n=1 Tax=Euphorbia lathyris TaxID=212925 RepID=UPI003313B8A3